MKIKELFEEQNTGYVGFRFNADITQRKSVTNTKYRDLEYEVLNKLTTKYDYDFQNLALDLRDEHFAVDLYVSSINQFDTSKLNTISDEIANILENLLFDYGYSVDDVSFWQLLIDYPCPFVINYPTLYSIIWEFEQETGLTGVNKYFDIPTKFQINFKEDRLIKSNVLSLLKIKNLTNITGSDNSKWIKIIDKYLKSDNRDILGCQDELIENGLSKFAKL